MIGLSRTADVTIDEALRSDLGAITARLLDKDHRKALCERDAALLCGHARMAHGYKKCVFTSFASVLGGSAATWRKRVSRLTRANLSSDPVHTRMRCKGRGLPIDAMQLMPRDCEINLLLNRLRRGEMLLFCRWVPTSSHELVRVMKYRVLRALHYLLSSSRLPLENSDWHLLDGIAEHDDDVYAAVAAMLAILYHHDPDHASLRIAELAPTILDRVSNHKGRTFTQAYEPPLLVQPLPHDIASVHDGSYQYMMQILEHASESCLPSSVFLSEAFMESLCPRQQSKYYSNAIVHNLWGKRGGDIRAALYGYAGLGMLHHYAYAPLRPARDFSTRDFAAAIQCDDHQNVLDMATEVFGGVLDLLGLVRFVSRLRSRN